MGSQLYTTPGTYSFNMDSSAPGVTSFTVETWGGGAGGITIVFNSDGGGGGGGGGYSRAVVTKTTSLADIMVGSGGSGGSLTLTAGGDSYFKQSGTTNCLAKGGSLGSSTTGGAGGSSGAGTGDVKYSGGTGGNGILGGGGGGSSAGTASNGTNGGNDDGGGNGGTGGSAPSGGGSGGAGGSDPAQTSGGSGLFPGGGGGGAPDVFIPATHGGDGAPGQVLITWTDAGSGASGTASGLMPLYISSTCGAAMRPSGDMGHSPSGHFFNFLGTSGNTTYYNYINSDPTSVISDSDYITIVQSGHKNRTDRIFYNNSTFPNVIKSFNVTGVTTTNYGLGVGKYKYNKEGFIYYYNLDGGLYRFRETVFADSGNPQLVTTYTANEGIAIDNKRRKIYTTIANTLYRYNYDGTSIETCSLAPLPPGATFNLVEVDTQNNVIYVGGYLSPYAQIAVVDGATFSKQCTLTGATLMSPQSMSVDAASGNLYVGYYGSFDRFSPLGCSGVRTVMAIDNLPIVRSDNIKDKLYIASGSKILQTNTNLSSAIDVGISDGTINEFNIDGPSYKSNIDFELGDLASGFGLTETQQATNVWVDIKGQEMYDYTNVYAQVLSRDKTKLIWENYPESCAQFFVASGAITQQIGLTGSAINGDYNNASDWNNSILRLYFYSNNYQQPSGNFRLYSAQVTAYCSGIAVTGSAASGRITLTMTGNSRSSGNIPLYVQGNTIFTSSQPSGISLYTTGYSRASGYIPLYISGSYLSSSMTFYTSGPVAGSGIENDTFIPLYMYSTTNSGINKNAPLIMVGDQSSRGYFPLYIDQRDGSSISGIYPLYIQGNVATTFKPLDLFVQNNYSASGLSFYTKGVGYTDQDPTLIDGGRPFQASFPLYMHRPNDVKVMPLFLCNTVTTSGTPLYVMGAYTQTSGIPLVMPTVYGSNSGIPPLFISGW